MAGVNVSSWCDSSKYVGFGVRIDRTKIFMKKPKNKRAGSALLAGLSLATVSAIAQDVGNLDQGIATPAPQAPKPEGQTNRQPVIVNAGVSEQFDSSMDKGGDFSLTRVKAGVGVPVNLNDGLQLGTTFRYEYDHFDFNNITAPWENINTFSLASILQWQMDDHWTIYGGGFVKMSAESGGVPDRWRHGWRSGWFQLQG